MTTISVERVIPCPRAEVFRVLAEFDGIHKFYALVDKSPLHDGSPRTGVGAARTCHFYDGNHIDERITHMEPDRLLTVDIYDGSMPIKSCVVHFNLFDAGSDSTKIMITADYALKFGLLGKAMDVLAVKKQFTGNLKTMISGLDHYIQTGEHIGKGWQPAAA